MNNNESFSQIAMNLVTTIQMELYNFTSTMTSRSDYKPRSAPIPEMMTSSQLDFATDSISLITSEDYNISTQLLGQVGNSTERNVATSNVVLCSFLFAVVIVTIVGNIIVLLAFAIDKRLTSQNIFNYYIINLAVTDLAVALLAMTFYTFDVLLGYWPFGQFMCGVWIFFDYGEQVYNQNI